MRGILLAVRSLMWVGLLPGFFAGYVPWRYFGLRDALQDLHRPWQWAGIAIAILGASLLGACVIEFARRGRGTLSPLDPPRRLVVSGLYRYVRNPMYLSVTLIVMGQVLLTGSSGLLLYWVLWFAAVNVFVMGYEEPSLRRQFGLEYQVYTEAVGRWVPRRRPWDGDTGIQWGQ